MLFLFLCLMGMGISFFFIYLAYKTDGEGFAVLGIILLFLSFLSFISISFASNSTDEPTFREVSKEDISMKSDRIVVHESGLYREIEDVKRYKMFQEDARIFVRETQHYNCLKMKLFVSSEVLMAKEIKKDELDHEIEK